MSSTSPPAETRALVARTLLDEVQRGLHATGYPALRGVNVVAISTVVLLQGRVPSYHMKQVAQATVMNLPGVREIRNELDVVFPQ
jgi:osmotically-inducible protein OsmY